jgi:putative membrane protein
MQQIKFILGVALLLLLVIFTAQNTEIVTLNLFFWKLSISRALIVFFTLGVGIFIGLLVGTSRMNHIKRQ